MRKTLVALVLVLASACSTKTKTLPVSSITGILSFTNTANTSYAIPLEITDSVYVLGPLGLGNHSLQFAEANERSYNLAVGDYFVTTTRGISDVSQVASINTSTPAPAVTFNQPNGGTSTVPIDPILGFGVYSPRGIPLQVRLSPDLQQVAVDQNGDQQNDGSRVPILTSSGLTITEDTLHNPTLLH